MTITRGRLAVFVAAFVACSPRQGSGFIDGGGAVSSTPYFDAGSCNVAADCANDQTCDRNDFSCFSPPGTCAPFDGGCDRSHPMCACDGQIYSDACALRDARQKLGYDVKCAPPSGEFQCGHEFCSITTEYCSPHGVCLPLPAACEVPDAGCSCLAGAGTIAECFCVQADAGYFELECTE